MGLMASKGIGKRSVDQGEGAILAEDLNFPRGQMLKGKLRRRRSCPHADRKNISGISFLSHCEINRAGAGHIGHGDLIHHRVRFHYGRQGMNLLIDGGEAGQAIRILRAE